MDTPLITPNNLNKICRICLIESDEKHSLFSVLQTESNEEGEFTYVYEILMKISSFKNVTDQLPTVLCTTCLELANISYKFQQQCNRSQLLLETYLTQFNPNTSNESGGANESNAISNIHSEGLLDVSTNYDDVSTKLGVNKIEIIEEHISNDMKDELDRDLDNEKVDDLVEQDLDASKVAALEDNVRLKAKLALKRLHNSNIENKLRIKFPRKKFNYFIKTTDNGSKVYACNLCDKMYKFGSSLKVHIRTHTLERPYVCKLCGKDFKQYGSLTYHLRSHSGEQPYKCKLCGKKYKQSGSLTSHMRVHTGQRPFLCSVCGRGFRQAPDLGYHMRTHTKEKPYMCNICGKTMSMQCHLVQHMRTHTGERPFKCTECGKAFPSTTRLKRHAIIHTGLKPYKCEVCDRSFNRKSSLCVHAKIHTDDRPHVCSVCGKGFIQAYSLRTHMATHYSSTPNSVRST